MEQQLIEHIGANLKGEQMKKYGPERAMDRIPGDISQRMKHSIKRGDLADRGPHRSAGNVGVGRNNRS